MGEEFLNIGKDCWNLISENGLSDKDLLSLRATCKFMNRVVKHMNELWFRAHQWFVIKHGSGSKVKSSVRKHTRTQDVTYNCIPSGHPIMYDPKYSQYPATNRYYGITRRKKIIEDGAFTLDDCKEKYHWGYVVPKKRDDIPHKGYNKERNYIYYYLIDCYRHKSHRKKTDMNINKRIMDRLENKYQEYMRCKNENEALAQQYVDNNIFQTAKVLTYQGP